ncbi:hypothetical protein BZA05DRAFT_397643 [Tricharina praecox]|uniref:uncharacterized protein n=1 Tax=Tricharina praecox TaxID=43433 RepID=UPI0022204C97|nr:uncharacterized protein BZA05DRAFT_397643 [Tricharina praecox]KAI5852352.1 hypothetical protein BZA05DRAFT_397643 [Tricharina praecox]
MKSAPSVKARDIQKWTKFTILIFSSALVCSFALHQRPPTQLSQSLLPLPHQPSSFLSQLTPHLHFPSSFKNTATIFSLRFRTVLRLSTLSKTYVRSYKQTSSAMDFQGGNYGGGAAGGRACYNCMSFMNPPFPKSVSACRQSGNTMPTGRLV